MSMSCERPQGAPFGAKRPQELSVLAFRSGDGPRLAELVGRAVEETFAELQPAWAEAVSARCSRRVCEALAAGTPEASAAEPSMVIGAYAGSGRNQLTPASCRGGKRTGTSESWAGCEQRLSSDSSFVSGQSSHKRNPREPAPKMMDSDWTAMSCKSSASVISVRSPPPTTGGGVPVTGGGCGPVTVQSMQASVAQALLEDVGFSFGRQSSGTRERLQESGHVATQSQSSNHRTSAARVQHFGTRIVPTPAVPEAGAPGGGTLDVDVKPSDGAFAGEDSARPARSSAPSSAPSWVEVASDTGKQNITSTQIFRARNSELAFQALRSTGRTGLVTPMGQDMSKSSAMETRNVPISLLVSGVLPWDPVAYPRVSSAYQWAARVVILLAAVLPFLPNIGYLEVACQGHDANCRQRTGFTGMALMAGALFVSLPFILPAQRDHFEEAFMLLSGVSLRRKFQGLLAQQGRWDAVIFAILWLGIAATTAIGDFFAREELANHIAARRTTLHVLANAILSGTILCHTHAMVFVCRMLATMVDVFCCDVLAQADLQDISHMWNLTQAVLRKASDSIEADLLRLCIVVMVVAPLLVVDVGLLGLRDARMVMLIPGVLVAIAVLYLFLLAAGISEKCSRVPALVNSMSAGEAMDVLRQRTVDYIESSAAGFYIFGMRLTPAVVVKSAYICCVVVVGLLGRVV
mmetsp:Transcript_123431/g.356852  ORF Transcript_123431/g.356852 Transcript_123431/m.356852 type:complete len:692 (+) Transcript_123431:83-2158(+)